jgi:hypothetical protein
LQKHDKKIQRSAKLKQILLVATKTRNFIHLMYEKFCQIISKIIARKRLTACDVIICGFKNHNMMGQLFRRRDIHMALLWTGANPLKIICL